MPPATAALVKTLNRLGTKHEGAILASMYRHLAHWPAYLALVWTMIAPLAADGRLGRAIDDVETKARARGGRVMRRLRAPSSAPPDAGVRVAIRAAIEPFTGDALARMIVICAMLRSATGGH